MASASLSSGVLTLSGTGANETLDLNLNAAGTTLSVFSSTAGGQIASFPRSSVDRVDFFGRGGDDLMVNRSDVPARMFGGNGDDVLVGGTANDILAGHAGNDQLRGDPSDTASVNAGDGGDDFIYGGSGHDYLNGVGGDDLLAGGTGNDFMEGGAGADSLFGEAGLDFLRGNDGNDFLFGGDHNDRIEGGFGNDRLSGQEGNDRLFPEVGNDIVNGDGGHDILFSNNTNGTNQLIGGVGNDRYEFSGSGAVRGFDVVVERQNEGFDTVEVGALTGVNINNIRSSVLVTYGERRIDAQLTGNIERINDASDVPQLSIQGRGANFRNGFSVIANDGDGISQSSNGVLKRVAFQGFTNNGRSVVVILTNVAPISRQVTSTGTIFTYGDFNAAIFQQYGNVGPVFNASLSVDVAAGTFRDVFGNTTPETTLSAN